MKKICVVYTGGTIGMVEEISQSGAVTRKPPQDPTSFSKTAPEIFTIADIEFEFLLNKDSTDMNPEDWTAIACSIYEKRESYDGFVVIHGTDTMHFTASALAFAFGKNLNFPIVFTGAQTTANVLHGDAKTNFIRAVFVATQNVAEVVICFGNYVFRGCRAQKKDERLLDAFHSPACMPLADIGESIRYSGGAKLVKAEGRGEIRFRPKFELGLLQISLIPGLLPQTLIRLLEYESIGAVILQSFGAGNVPMSGEFSFEKFINEARDRDIPVVIASQFPANSTLHSIYQPGKGAVSAGAIPTGNMTNAAATAKLRWVLARVNDELKRKSHVSGQKLHLVKEYMSTIEVNEMDGME